MRIHCDHCGVEIDKESSFSIPVGEEVYWFCTEECYAKASHLDPLQYPERDEQDAGSEAAPDLGGHAGGA